jgi:hypothetical protein
MGNCSKKSIFLGVTLPKRRVALYVPAFLSPPFGWLQKELHCHRSRGATDLNPQPKIHNLKSKKAMFIKKSKA